MVMPKERGISDVQILFSKTIEQCRQLGARGGRTFARNLRLRRSQAQLQPQVLLPDPPAETAHEASLLLDSQFPWLVDAFTPRPLPRYCVRRSQPVSLPSPEPVSPATL